ncbi:hypothetical protein O181_013329 [Austropuccinia psidii MF-1]|uniref:Uncharacterized protein n=1 Tax=Austropuccinia psidii MF-1 TaxID=1389203 RepID=A0A9Q3BY05_9BASI|nr:hypothetical protein [Austropuccinia psidii MF-1]
MAWIAKAIPGPGKGGPSKNRKEGPPLLIGSKGMFQSQVVPSTPRNFQPVLSTIPSSIPPPSPNPSASRPAIVSPAKPSHIPQPRNYPMVSYQQLQLVASCSRRKEELLPFPFPSAQVFQKREHWTIPVTR